MSKNKSIFSQRSFNLGILCIALFAIPAIPGYLTTPDNTSNANQLSQKIANQKPGFTCSFLKIDLQLTHEASTLNTWLYGEKTTWDRVPIERISWSNIDSIAILLWNENSQKSYAKKELIPTKNGAMVHKQTFYLGTDRNGRDMLSRLIIGARVSLIVGFVSVFISLFIGLVIGLSAGYFGGRVDSILSWLIAVFWSVPTLLIALGLSFAFGKGLVQVLITIGFSTWVEVARIVRGQTLQIREQEYILSTQIMGFKPIRIIIHHILPNLKGTIVVLATTNFASAILLEAGLSFLGLGVAPPAPSWGIMVKEHLGNLVLDTYYLALIPGFAIMLMVMAFNWLAMGIRNHYDTRL